MPHNDIMYEHFMKGKYINNLSDNSGLYGVCQSGCVNRNHDRSGSRPFSIFECGCVCGGGGGAYMHGTFSPLYLKFGDPRKGRRGVLIPRTPPNLDPHKLAYVLFYCNLS